MRDIAADLWERVEARAAKLDAEAAFPMESYAELTDAGYLRGIVPKDLGGLGADLHDASSAQRVLGSACASTALAVNMHLFQVGAAADGWYASGANEAPLRTVAEQDIILGSTGAEAISAGAWSTPTTAVREHDEYVINGRKYFCSQAPAMDLVRVNAMDTETGEVLVIAIPADQPGVRVVETWDTTGMRGTASHDLVLEDVRVPAAAVGARLSPDGPAWEAPFATAIKWFLPLTASVYAGIGDRARQLALESVSTGTSSQFRAEALTHSIIGRLEATHFTMSSVLEAGVSRIASCADPVEAMTVAITTKDVVTDSATEVVDVAVQLQGGRAFFRRSPMERLVRDVRAARHHPPADPVSAQMVGAYLASN